jgi:putative ABC transport system permease protein
MLLGFGRAARGLARDPGSWIASAGAIALGALAVALGIALWSANRAGGLPFPRPRSVVCVYSQTPGSPRLLANSVEARRWAATDSVFIGATAMRPRLGATLSTPTGVIPVRAFEVAPATADWLGVRPALGSATLAPGSVLLAFPFWKRRFGGRGSVIGKMLSISGREYRIGGVMPPGFGLARYVFPGGWPRTQVYLPLRFTRRDARMNIFPVLARLRAGVSPRVAAERLHVIAGAGERNRIAVVRLADWATAGDQGAERLTALALAIMLLLACANCTAVFAARAHARAPELALRSALGAGRLRAALSPVAEAVLVAVPGSLAGVLAAAWLAASLPVLLPRSLILLAPPKISPLIALATVAGALALAVVVSGAVSAATLPREPRGLAKLGTVTAGRATRGARSAAVVAEVCVAVALATGALLPARALWRRGRAERGFRADHLLRTQVVLFGHPKLRSRAAQRRFAAALLARLPPWAGGFAISSGRPGVAVDHTAYGLAAPVPRSGAGPQARFQIVAGSYFSLLQIRRLAGRAFSAKDGPGSAPVCTVDEALARAISPRDPLRAVGRSLFLQGEQTPRRIVGIVSDVRFYAEAARRRPEIYVPFSQSPIPAFALLTRPAIPRRRLDTMIRSAAAAIAPVPVGSLHPLRADIAAEDAPVRLWAFALAILAAASLAMALAGSYALARHLFAGRARELALRASLGAGPWKVLAEAMRDAGRLVGLGAGLGAAAGWLFVQTITASLSLPGGGVLVPALTAVFVASAAGAAVVVPARRVFRIDLAALLKSE